MNPFIRDCFSTSLAGGCFLTWRIGRWGSSKGPSIPGINCASHFSAWRKVVSLWLMLLLHRFVLIKFWHLQIVSCHFLWCWWCKHPPDLLIPPLCWPSDFAVIVNAWRVLLILSSWSEVCCPTCVSLVYQPISGKWRGWVGYVHRYERGWGDGRARGQLTQQETLAHLATRVHA